MRYDLRLSIAYATAGPARALRTHIRAMPLQVPGVQRVLTAGLAADPAPDGRLERADFFGNSVTELFFERSAGSLAFTVEARVERLAEAGRLDLSPGPAGLAAEIAAWRDLGPAAPHHFRAPGPRTPADPAIAAFAREAAPAGATALETVAAVGRALHGAMRFDPGATDVTTAPGDAFAARHGVCQDFSHVLIVALRALGIPAGYVSGVLRTEPPPGQHRLEGADAMHAWVRAWCGAETGWAEYDPTNDMMAGPDHVAVAIGRDYAEAAPVRGALRAAGGQVSRHSVDLVPVP